AETLRAEGTDGRIVLIGDEPDRPYERPPLSKGYLRGEEGREKVYVHGEDFYRDNAIELRTATRVTVIDPSSATVSLETGESLHYDQLLLATGAAPRNLSVPGSDLSGVRYLRSVEDSDGLREAIRVATRVVVVGAGWIGSEVAASARQMGREVAVIEMGSVPLERVLGPEIGAVFRDLHADHGVEMHMDTAVAALVGSAGVEGVRTGTGAVIPGDLIVVGVGVSPRVELAAAAGLATDNGILVDEHLETSFPRIYAAGDVANAFHPFFGRRLRVEHWSNARHQGAAAARSMLGQEISYDRIPFFFSDQYDLGMEYSGYATEWDQVVLRGDPRSREFIAFWMLDGMVLAGMNVNVWDVADPIQRLVRSRLRVDVDQLRDPDIPLTELAAAPA
ncbi:MAG TPA: FAD-dependent oxidoreductase, partial [Acidimicrobiia bacterium]|nr:FAD-dependent oxidoreductase [Acidimicrobiia bacterium]